MPSCSTRHTAVRAALRAKLWMGLACVPMLASGAHAALADHPHSLGTRVEIESLPYAIQPRVAFTGARALFDSPSDGLRTRVWWGKRGVEVGAGANVNLSNTAPGLATTGNSGTAVLGLRAQVAQGAYLAFERDTLAASAGAGAPVPVEGARLALEFKAVGASKAAQPLSSGLLRVQMSGTSSLQFKPRSGGMAVTYRAKF